jgi:hypothetical protein
MNVTNHEPLGHSAIVHTHLYVNGSILPVSQLGPNFLILKNPFDHPPTDAEISMSIDGREDRWRIRLPDGIQTGKLRTPISKCSVCNGSAV